MNIHVIAMQPIMLAIWMLRKRPFPMLAIGKKLSSKMSKEAYVEQIREESGFFPWLSEKLSSHPDLPKRINALDHWVNPEQYPLLRDKKTGLVVGIIVSIVMVAALTGVVTLFVKSATAFSAFLEEPYLYGEEEEEAMISYPPVVQAVMDEDME